MNKEIEQICYALREVQKDYKIDFSRAYIISTLQREYVSNVRNIYCPTSNTTLGWDYDSNDSISRYKATRDFENYVSIFKEEKWNTNA